MLLSAKLFSLLEGALLGFWFLSWECRSLVRWVELPYCDQCGGPIMGVVEHMYICYFSKIEREHMIALSLLCGMAA